MVMTEEAKESMGISEELETWCLEYTGLKENSRKAIDTICSMAVWPVPMLGRAPNLMLGCRSFEILSFCTGSHKLCSQSWVQMLAVNGKLNI